MSEETDPETNLNDMSSALARWPIGIYTTVNLYLARWPSYNLKLLLFLLLSDLPLALYPPAMTTNSSQLAMVTVEINHDALAFPWLALLIHDSWLKIRRRQFWALTAHDVKFLPFKLDVSWAVGRWPFAPLY